MSEAAVTAIIPGSFGVLSLALAAVGAMLPALLYVLIGAFFAQMMVGIERGYGL